MDAKEIIEALALAPHPEGGWYRETWRADAVMTSGGAAAEAADGGTDGEADGVKDGRATGTAIYYLLEGDQFSHWHKVDAAEIWLWHAGAPLALTLSPDGHDAEARILGPEIAQGQRPQQIVPAGWWQTAASLGRFTLVSCTVSPGFIFDGFEMAPPDWRPTPRAPKG